MDATTWDELDKIADAMSEPQPYLEQCEVCGVEFVSEGKKLCPDCEADDA